MAPPGLLELVDDEQPTTAGTLSLRRVAPVEHPVARWLKDALLAPLSPFTAMMLFFGDVAGAWTRYLDVRELRADGQRKRLEFSVSFPRFLGVRSLTIRYADLDSLALWIGAEGPSMPLRLRMAFRDDGRPASLDLVFAVAEVDRREEAVDLFLRLARALRCGSYRVRREGDDGLELELLLGPSSAGGHAYRALLSTPDALAVPDVGEAPEYGTRAQEFAEPPGYDDEPFDARKVGPYTIAEWKPGERIAIDRARSLWSLLLLLLLPVHFVVRWGMVLLPASMVIGVIGVVVVVMAALLGLDLGVVFWAVTAGGSVIMLLATAVYGAYFIYRDVAFIAHDTFGSTLDIDWRAERVTLGWLGYRRSVALTSVHGVALRGKGDTQRVMLQLPSGDHEIIAHESSALRALAVELARALDVPVSFSH